MIAIHNKYNKTNKRKHRNTRRTIREDTEKMREAIEMLIPREISPRGSDLAATERNIIPPPPPFFRQDRAEKSKFGKKKETGESSLSWGKQQERLRTVSAG